MIYVRKSLKLFKIMVIVKVHLRNIDDHSSYFFLMKYKMYIKFSVKFMIS